MSMSVIQQLVIYPIKGLSGVSVDQILFTSFGPLNDRKYMLVNHKNKMITQRSHSILSQYKLQEIEGGWRVISPNKQTVDIMDDESGDDVIATEVWATSLQTREKSKSVSAWFSQELDELVKLVQLDDLESRQRDFKGHSAAFAFADGYPLLVCNQQSLDTLNEQMNNSLSMVRFRPNVVISIPSKSEYSLAKMNHGSAGELLFTKPCVRCNVPAIEPETSAFQRDIHNALRDYLMQDSNVVFGMNAIPVQLEALRVGDELQYSSE